MKMHILKGIEVNGHVLAVGKTAGQKRGRPFCAKCGLGYGSVQGKRKPCPAEEAKPAGSREEARRQRLEIHEARRVA